MEQLILKDLHSSSYEHPLDRKTLDALQKTKGLDFIVKKYFEFGMEKLLRIQYTGSNIRVNENNLAELHQTFKNICEIIYLPRVPDLYTSWEYGINGFTTGIENPLVVINSGCMDLLEEKELMYVMGHEIGHIKSNHVMYHTIAGCLSYITEAIGAVTLGLGDMLSMGLELALFSWSRMSEFTADRAGLLACQDLNSAISAIIKMAGIPKSYYDKISIEEFIKQAQEFKEFDYDNLNKVYKFLTIKDQSHPWTVLRAAELLKWVESGEYDKIIKGNYTTCTDINSCCPKCGAKITNDIKFCTNCGYKLSQVIKANR